MKTFTAEEMAVALSANALVMMGNLSSRPTGPSGEDAQKGMQTAINSLGLSLEDSVELASKVTKKVAAVGVQMTLDTLEDIDNISSEEMRTRHGEPERVLEALRSLAQ